MNWVRAACWRSSASSAHETQARYGQAFTMPLPIRATTSRPWPARPCEGWSAILTGSTARSPGATRGSRRTCAGAEMPKPCSRSMASARCWRPPSSRPLATERSSRTGGSSPRGGAHAEADVDQRPDCPGPHHQARGQVPEAPARDRGVVGPHSRSEARRSGGPVGDAAQGAHRVSFHQSHQGRGLACSEGSGDGVGVEHRHAPTTWEVEGRAERLKCSRP